MRTASNANGGFSLFLVPSNVALKLTNARAAATARDGFYKYPDGGVKAMPDDEFYGFD
jgi:hypothetical protein